MTKPFDGQIELDIRDSEPDWEPYLAPKAPDGAPNVLLLAWDDLGYATMDMLRRPGRVPEHGAASRSVGVKFSNFHTTALCSPTRASLLTGRNATTNGMATIAEFASGFPGISTRIPFENGFISEVLAEHGYNTYCVGKWHLTPGEECNLAAFKGRWPLGRGFERFYGWLGGETNSYYPDLVHDNHPIEPPGRPEDGYHLADDMADKAVEFIRDAKVIDPGQAVLHVPRPAGRPRPPPRADSSGPTGTRACFDEGYEAIRAGILRAPDRAGPAARGHRAVADQPPRRARAAPAPTASPGRMLDTVRPWDSLSDDEQRLFARMAEVFAGYISYYDDQLGRVLDYLEESGQLDNTIIVVVSDNGASGEGGPNGSFNEWRFFNGVRRHHRVDAAPHRRARHPGVEQPLQHRLGVGARHAVPVLEALGRRRGRRRRHVPRAVAGQDPGVHRDPPAVHPRRRRRADDLRPARHRAARGDQGLPAEPDRGRELRRRRSPTRPCPGKSTQFYTMLGQRSIYHEGWLACDRAPAAQRLGQLREGRVGAVPPRDRPVPDQQRGRRRTRAARAAEGPVVLLRRHLQRPAARRPLRARAGARRAAPAGRATRPVRLLPELRRRARVGRARSFRAARTRSPPGSTSTRPTSRA